MNTAVNVARRGGLFEPIPPIPFPGLWRTDTRSIVGSVLLAVAFSANMQITERLDTATVGGIIPWTALPFGIMWFTAACFFFGMTGALITASFNPIIAVLTATGPLAPIHFTINWSFNIPMAMMAAYVLGKRQPITCRPADLLEPGLERARKDAAGLASSEEDVLTYALFPEIARDFFLGREADQDRQPAASRRQ